MKSVILSINPEYNKTLMGFLAPVQVPGKGWEMCYRGSEQNFSASAFHSLCNYKGPTVTIVRVNQNVFGGYTDKNWTSGKNRVRIPTRYSVRAPFAEQVFQHRRFSYCNQMTRFEKTVKKRWRICPFSFFLCLSVCLSVYEQITIIGPYTQAYKLPALRSTIVPVRVQDLCFLKRKRWSFVILSCYRAPNQSRGLLQFTKILKYDNSSEYKGMLLLGDRTGE